MPSALERAQVSVTAGRYPQAVDAMWDALRHAQEQDDLETLAALAELAERICVHGDARSVEAAQRIIASIGGLHPQAADGERPRTHTRVVMTTGNDVPGETIAEIIGPIFAMTVRSRDLFTQWGAKIKGGSVGGELRGMTEALEQSRVQVLARLDERARVLNADAVIALRFDVSEMAGTWTEICVYGTAVRLAERTAANLTT